MSRTDLIADSFTIIRNALQVRKDEALLPFSKSLAKILDILVKEGYLENSTEVELGNFKKLKVYLKYNGKHPAIKKIQRVSTPGRRTYMPHGEIPSVLEGLGTGIFSTSQGILTDKEARAKGVGGEFIGMVW